ncbi:PREDICTED: putative uncharacterized protein CXorf58 [Branchiostoma belcheri]|uniref:Uncharacterized protein n=1 Tax=Branchiostoma belcheri TaxID=7741 RepID=A0A6P5AF75_BRABE|nr:PREDICTED: putative uncharacterized protein CXorf58 [Branchiostoma belcheri]
MTREMSAKEQNGPEGGSPQNGTVHSISPGPRGSKISIKIPSEHAYQQTETQTDEFLMGPRPGSVAEDEIIKMTATRVIERAWLSYRDRQMFKLLKHAVCAAEHCLSFEILRKVSPMEANLLKDPSFQVRVRFRFAGSDFPPEIVFKVFIHTGGQGVNYVSGKRVIKPATNAAADSCRLMGHRKFYDQMIRDACQHEKDRVTDEIDIITMKDYMQYLSNMDETPAYMGGKENLWRKLSLEALPRQSIMYDIVEYLYHTGTPSSRLQEDLPILMSRPITQEIQLQHIQAISQLRTPPPAPCTTAQSRTRPRPLSSGGRSQRGSKQAKKRAQQMKKLYQQEGKEGLEPVPSGTPLDEVGRDQYLGAPGEDQEDWEQEADKLYEWTQELNFDDLVTTPRYEM